MIRQSLRQIFELFSMNFEFELSSCLKILPRFWKHCGCNYFTIRYESPLMKYLKMSSICIYIFQKEQQYMYTYTYTFIKARTYIIAYTYMNKSTYKYVHIWERDITHQVFCRGSENRWKIENDDALFGKQFLTRSSIEHVSAWK